MCHEISLFLQSYVTYLLFTQKFRLVASVTGQLADTPTRGLPTGGLDDSRTGHLADWSTRGLADAAKKEN